MKTPASGLLGKSAMTSLKYVWKFLCTIVSRSIKYAWKCLCTIVSRSFKYIWKRICIVVSSATKVCRKYFFKVLNSTWPIAVTVAIFYVLRWAVGSGYEMIDVRKWPSAFDYQSCLMSDQVAPRCEAISSFDQLTRILSACAAILPMMNYARHMVTVIYAYSRLNSQRYSRPNNQGAGLSDALTYLTVVFVMAALGANVIWIASIVREKFDAKSNTEELIILAMFLLLSAVDLMLIFMLSIDRTEEGQIELGYFSGSFLFIDLPTLFGIIAMMEIVAPAISPSFGVDRFPVVQAFFGGSLVMHIALAQIVLAFLIFLRKSGRSVIRKEVTVGRPPDNPPAAVRSDFASAV